MNDDQESWFYCFFCYIAKIYCHIVNTNIHSIYVVCCHGFSWTKNKKGVPFVLILHKTLSVIRLQCTSQFLTCRSRRETFFSVLLRLVIKWFVNGHTHVPSHLHTRQVICFCMKNFLLNFLSCDAL